jgi:anti-sigma regulatory factor (Ser/Thr protein kinase)
MERMQTFPALPASIRRAREFVADAVGDTGVDVAVIRLLTSELATNAVVHTQSPFAVRVLKNRETVRVEIINDEPELLLSVQDPSERGGRGLHVVTTLAADWGAESRRGDKVVWFEVPTGTEEHASVHGHPPNGSDRRPRR